MSSPTPDTAKLPDDPERTPAPERAELFSGVEYVRADIYEEARGSLDEWVRDGKVMEARIASLERELHEARERARLFEGLPEPDEFGWWDGREVPVRLEGSGESWFVNVYNWTGSPVDYETAKWKTVAEGTLAECLTALRTALASHSVEEDPE